MLDVRLIRLCIPDHGAENKTDVELYADEQTLTAAPTSIVVILLWLWFLTARATWLAVRHINVDRIRLQSNCDQCWSSRSDLDSLHEF